MSRPSQGWSPVSPACCPDPCILAPTPRALLSGLSSLKLLVRPGLPLGLHTTRRQQWVSPLPLVIRGHPPLCPKPRGGLTELDPKAQQTFHLPSRPSVSRWRPSRRVPDLTLEGCY